MQNNTIKYTTVRLLSDILYFMVPDLFVISVVNFAKHGEDLYYYIGMLESLIQVLQQILID